MWLLRAFLPLSADERNDTVARVRRQLDQCIVLAAINLILTAMVLVTTFRMNEALP